MEQGRAAVATETDVEAFDVVVIGAGPSGIGMGCHLKRSCPQLSFVMLERRNQIGGTWDLFHYPGIRSDSDMFTFGYEFKPWDSTRMLADGASIQGYLHGVVEEYGLGQHIRFGQRVVSTDWSTHDKRWTVTVRDEDAGTERQLSAGFVVFGTGYYDYDAGYRPQFKEEKSFGGEVVDPQFWPQDLDCSGKRVVVIGSGATAITLVPEMAKRAAHVTMLQRSPTYILSIPNNDKMARLAKHLLPPRLSFDLIRTRNLNIQLGVYKLSRRYPKPMRHVFQWLAKHQLASGYDMQHFTPRYKPWDQRLCIVPDGDLFKTIRSGTASVETGTIDRFVESGILLDSGLVLDADVIVKATGLAISLFGKSKISIDGEPVSMQGRLVYKGTLFSGIPNAGFLFGYTNASYTLKTDLSAGLMCRILDYMRTRGALEVVANARPEDRAKPEDFQEIGADGLSSGYLMRAMDSLPGVGKHWPWFGPQDYFHDLAVIKHAQVLDGVIAFDGVAPPAPPQTPLERIKTRARAALIPLYPL